MPKPAILSPFYAVTQQLQAEDLPALAEQGVQSLVNNRPDGEGTDQPRSDEIRAAAHRLGMDWADLPVHPGAITDAHVDEFSRLMQELRGPVVGFCRTGTRAASLWALSSARQLHPEAVLRACDDAGYDLQGLRPRLEDCWRNAPGAGGPSRR